MKRISVIGIIVLISISSLFKGLFFDFEANIFSTALVGLTLVYLFNKLKNSEKFVINNMLIIPGIILLLAYLLGFINAVSIRNNIEALLQYSLYLIIALVLYDYFIDNKHQLAAYLLPAIATAGFICSALGLLDLSGSIVLQHNFGYRLCSTFQYANTASIYFVFCLLIVLTLSNATDKILLRSLYAIAGNSIIFAYLLTSSRGGFIVGILAIIIFLVLQPKGTKIRIIVMLLCMSLPVFAAVNGFSVAVKTENHTASIKWILVSMTIALSALLLFHLFLKLMGNKQVNKTISMVAIIINTLIGITILTLTFLYRDKLVGLVNLDLIDRLSKINPNDINISGRLQYNKDALSLISTNWLTGLGGDGWISLYQSVQDYFYTAREVHNHYFDIFIETGIFGFIAYISLVIAAIFNFIKAYIKTVDKKLRIHISGLFCGFIGLALHSSFDFDLSYPSIALIFWALMAGAAIYNNSKHSLENTIENTKGIMSTANKVFVIIFIIICSAMFSVNGLYTVASYNAQKGTEFSKGLNYQASMMHYEEAYRLDPINPEYTFELSKLYNYFAKHETDKGKLKKWRELALNSSEKSVSLDSYYPAYRELLGMTYMDSGMPIQSLEQIEKLVEYQPMESNNYELLAEGYLEAAYFYIEAGEKDKAREMALKCLSAYNNTFAIKTPQYKTYEGKARLLIDDLK